MTLTRVAKRIWYALAAAIVAAALLVTTGYVVTPYINKNIPNVESWVSHLLATPVSIGSVSFSWDIYEPQLAFDQVKFLDPLTHQPKIFLDRVSINFALFNSLFAKKVMIEKVKLSGAHLVIRQNSTGELNVNELANFKVSDHLSTATTDATKIIAWMISTPILSCRNFNIEFQSNKGVKQSYVIDKIVLHNSGDTHTLKGRGVLVQEVPTKLSFNLSWKGNQVNLAEVSAHAYFYLEGINLTQWFSNQTWHNLQIKQGLGSAKIWLDWANNDFQKIQTKLQMYDFEVMSSTTKKIKKISRLNAILGWRRDGDKQIIAGDQVFLDFPGHLWPESSFSLSLTPDANGKLVLKNLMISFLDLTDVQEFAAFGGWLSDETQKKLQALNVKGEINNLEWINSTATPLDQISVTPSNFSLVAIFHDLSVNPFEKIPGLKNMSGSLSWNGNKGQLKLDSQNVTVSVNQLFPHDFYFNQLTGTVDIEQNAEKHWLLAAKALTLQNADLKASVDVQLHLPSDNASPELKMTGGFSVMDVTHLADYFPLKLFDADLVTWLRNAFRSGEVTSGKVLFEGRLADFPFTAGKGVFAISGHGVNIDFHYAPDWPMLHNVNGDIQFNNDLMTIDVNKAMISDIPVTHIHAEINHFSDKEPQMLTAEGSAVTDATNGLRFIHASPLEKTIGNDFGDLELRGAMQLKLGLSLPLAKPNDVKVKGEIQANGQQLLLPAWKFAIDDLKGVIHFTESDLKAENVKGKLFGEEAILNILTQHPANAPAFLQATLQSQLSIATLEKMLDVSLASVASGQTAFSAELHLYSQKENQAVKEVNIHTDLKGIALTLPENYGKKAEEIKSLQIDILVKNQDVRIKTNYGATITAALIYEKTLQKLHFISGEVSLGGEADWQKEPGLLVSGNFDQLDWDTLQAKFSQKSSIDTNLINRIAINANVFSIFSQQLHKARMMLTKAGHAWVVNINSNEVVGEVTVPMGKTQQEIQGKFQRLYLREANDTVNKITDFKDVPPIIFTIGDARYNEKNLGSITLNVEPAGASVLTIHDFRMQSPLVDLHAEGEWKITKGKSSSHLYGTLFTDRLSELLKVWGHGSSDFVAKKSNLEFDLNWPAEPYAPTPIGMSGKLTLNIGPGHILNVGASNNAKMDFGKLLNLFSLNSIPRRLTLDFSDVVDKGYGFDYIKGDFNLTNGSAETDNMVINGPIARVTVKGRIGLAARDVDARVNVTPYVTSSIPTVVAIASMNPLAGVATWAVDKVIGKAVSKAATYHYTVHGGWDAPVWEQVK